MTKLYYCKAGGHYWYYANDDETTEPLFFAWVDANIPAAYLRSMGRSTVDMTENAEEKYCGCND